MLTVVRSPTQLKRETARECKASLPELSRGRENGFMRNRYVLANVLHRPVRTLVSVLAISLEVLLILMVVGICEGMIVETAERQKGIGADTREVRDFLHHKIFKPGQKREQSE